MRTHFSIAILFVSALMMISAPASARVKDESEGVLKEGDVIGNFTRSMQTVYSAMQSCKNYDSQDIQGYLALIDQYLISRYPNGTPYWVNVSANSPMKSKDECLQTIVHRLIIYQKASTDFANNYPDEPTPPPLAQKNLAKWNVQQDDLPSLHLVSQNLVHASQ